MKDLRQYILEAEDDETIESSKGNEEVLILYVYSSIFIIPPFSIY